MGCGGEPPHPTPTSSASGAALTAPASSAAAPGDTSPDAAALDALLMAEHKRLSTEVRPEHLANRSPAVRIAAARALARIGGDAALPGLTRLLADDHPDVVTWAAYGLGFSCAGHQQPHVAALAARAASLLAGVPPDKTRTPLPAASVPPVTAIARAIGACGGETAEATLVAWLGATSEVAEAASLGLGDLALAKQKLREETIVALLQRAAGSAAEPPLPAALFPLGRLDHPPPSTIDRLREVATASLGTPGPSRLFAVRALGRAGEEAAPTLGRVIATPGDFTAPERGEAARAITRLGKPGQRALADAVPRLLPSADPVALTGLVSEDFGATLAALEAMTDPGPAEKALRELAARPPPPSPPPAIARRLSWLRCTAAKLVAGKNHRDPLLLGCEVPGTTAASTPKNPSADPPSPTSTAAPAPPAAATPSSGAHRAQPVSDTPAPAATSGPPKRPVESSIAARTIVDVLGRADLKGARLTAWRAYAEGSDIRAREAAIALLETHDEVDGAAAVLAKALASRIPGVVGAAAEVLTKHPERAADTPSKKRKKKNDKKDDDSAEPTIALGPPSPAIVKAVLALLQKKDDVDPELDDAVLDAAAALGIKEAEPRLTELCRSPYPTTREHAAKAIALLTGKKLPCAAPAEGGPVPGEMHALTTARTKLVLDTDAGQFTLTLDPALAPVAVTRVVELAQSGYYDRMVVHRVVAGFVTQFGAPFGDGSGGPEGKPPLRCETSPLPFEAQKIGVALAGRDTGSSQLFVMHGRFPHLDGKYALLGAAAGPWGAFVDGDIIHKVTVTK